MNPVPIKAAAIFRLPRAAASARITPTTNYHARVGGGKNARIGRLTVISQHRKKLTRPKPGHTVSAHGLGNRFNPSTRNGCKR